MIAAVVEIVQRICLQKTCFFALTGEGWLAAASLCTVCVWGGGVITYDLVETDRDRNQDRNKLHVYVCTESGSIYMYDAIQSYMKVYILCTYV